MSSALSAIWTGPRSGNMIYLDTHVVVWLYIGEPSRLGDNAKNENIRENYSPAVW